MKAPSRSELTPSIVEYFQRDRPVIVIGQNISFDMDFLQKYFPDAA